MKKGLLFISILLILLSACSKNRRDNLMEETLTITSDKATLMADGTDMVTFSVTNRTQKDITSDVEIKVNEEVLQGNTFTTIKEGVYEVVATKGKIVSNTLKITAQKKEAKLQIQVDKEVFLANSSDKVTFTVKKIDGTDITDRAKIMVNGIMLSGNTYVTGKPGEYKAKALYENDESPEITFFANEVKDINLIADNVSLVLGEKDKITFTVKEKSGEDLTKESVIYINDKAIQGNVYQFTEVGTYFAYAQYKGNLSNNLTIEVKAPTQYGLTITAAKNTFLADGVDAVNFICINTLDNNKDLTKEVKFYANGKELKSDFLKTTTAGTYNVTAKFNSYTSNSVTVKTDTKLVPTPHVYAEDFTALWCQYCPRFLFMMEKAGKDLRILPMAIHSGDKFETKEVKTIGTFLKVEGYPTVIVNRHPMYKLSSNSVSAILKYLPATSPVGVALEVTENGSSVHAVAHIYSQNDMEDISCVAILYENGLIGDQTNSVYPEYGNPIKDMEHNHVYRTSHEGQTWGESITLKAGKVLKKEFDFDIKSGWNAKNLGVTVLITKKDRTVINGQRANVNSAAGY